MMIIKKKVDSVEFCLHLDKMSQFEQLYYMDYYIRSALYTINKIINGIFNSNPFLSEIQQYHYYTDHLVNLLGQISQRMHSTKKNHTTTFDEMFKVDSSQFNNIMRNKKIRDIVEHINEKDSSALNKYNQVSYFNVIKNENENIAKEVQDDNKVFMYTLDLTNYSIIVREESEKYTLNIIEFRNELEKLQRLVDKYTNGFFKLNNGKLCG